MKDNDNIYNKNPKDKADSFKYDKFEKEYYMDELEKYMSGQYKNEKNYRKTQASNSIHKKSSTTYKLYGDKSYLTTTKKKIKKKSWYKRLLKKIFESKKPNEITYEDALAREALKTQKVKTKLTPMQKRKRKIKVLIRRVIIGILIPFSILLYIDQIYLSTSNNPYKNEVVNATIKDIPKDAKSISFSSDNTSYIYIKDSNLFIKYIKDQSMRKTLVDAEPIVAAVPMEDRNIILYFTIEKNVKYTEQIKQETTQAQTQYDPENPSGGQSKTTTTTPQTVAPQTVTKITDVLKVKTYNLDSGESTLQQSIKINNFDSVEQVEYSSKTNVIYLKLGAKTTISEMDYIYRINIMKTVTLFSSAPKLGNMGILSTEDSIFYEYNNAIFYNWNVISELNNLKPKLLDCAGDIAYIASSTKPNTIYKFKGVKKDGEITLNDSAYKYAYQNRGKVYLIYDTYMIELTGNLQNKINFDNGAKFLAVSNGVMYTQDADGTVKNKKIN